VQGAVFTVMVLRLGQTGIADFERAVRSQIGRSPQFFAKAPVVLDLKESHGLTAAADFLELKRLLRGLDLVPVGVQNANPAQQEAAAKAELGTFTGASTQRRSNATPSAARAAPTAAAKSLLVTEPVRSGTQLYARNADLIVLKSVSAGAEIIADGHIHVYGTLRGRAIAGATGDGEARIFVRRLEPELVSIAGRYLVRDEIASEHIGQGAQILLEDERMVIVEN
jgi:septum site-determining protein MinC